MAQLNPLVGDIAGNSQKIIRAIDRARHHHKAQCIVFSELVLSGYPPEDLLLRPAFIKSCETAIQEITRHCDGITAIVGAPYSKQDKLYNAAHILSARGEVRVATKQCLPNYSVFDEERYFTAGTEPCLIELTAGIIAGITICEDIWYPEPVKALADAGASCIINLNASPYHFDKQSQRLDTLRSRIGETGLPIIYVNQVGGQDELVFDGVSMAVDATGEIVVCAPAFSEDLVVVDIETKQNQSLGFSGNKALLESDEAMLYQALVHGVRDYVIKNDFPGAILGLSGGIDSALTLAIAVDALGADKVGAVMMPSQYTADMSQQDARAEADILGVEYHVIPIAQVFDAFNDLLADVFRGQKQDVTEENLQARSRGVILMAISNKQGKMVLTTGNKSEMAVGYATLYGDMAGGFAPLKDVYKTMVYRLARYRNTLGQVIPERVIERPPSAELAPNQTDQDTLPDYGVLDEILRRYVELDESVEEIVSAGYDQGTVIDIARRVDRNEYKRRQAPPGIKVTQRAFGKDRRYPITSVIVYL